MCCHVAWSSTTSTISRRPPRARLPRSRSPGRPASVFGLDKHTSQRVAPEGWEKGITACTSPGIVTCMSTTVRPSSVFLLYLCSFTRTSTTSRPSLAKYTSSTKRTSASSVLSSTSTNPEAPPHPKTFPRLAATAAVSTSAIAIGTRLRMGARALLQRQWMRR